MWTLFRLPQGCVTPPPHLHCILMTVSAPSRLQMTTDQTVEMLVDPRSIGDRSSVTICRQVNSCTYLGVHRCPPARAFSSCNILLTVDVLEDTSHRPCWLCIYSYLLCKWLYFFSISDSMRGCWPHLSETNVSPWRQIKTLWLGHDTD